MRLFCAGVTFLVFSLACGGGGFAPEPAPVAVPEVVAVVPAPVPEPAPAAPGDILAVVAPFSGDDVAVVCTAEGKATTCPTGPCFGEYADCRPGPEVKVIGMASLAEGDLSLPLAGATLTDYIDPSCSWPVAEIMEGDATTPPRPVVAVPQGDPALATIALMAGEAAVVTAWRLNIDGDGGDEILADVTTEMGSLLVVLWADQPPSVVFDTRREPLGMEADDQARIAYELEASSMVFLGVTDSEPDGTLEIVAEGSGYESHWIVVLKLDGTAVGSVGCAV